uniref:Uncharacterized protein n=2 Tax=Triticum urartu TaxID=4572 RepID=A0A8R7TEC3_TRIUA
MATVPEGRSGGPLPSLVRGVPPFPSSCSSDHEGNWALQRFGASSGMGTSFSGVHLHHRWDSLWGTMYAKSVTSYTFRWVHLQPHKYYF